jgi:hypothetical protein
VLCTARLLPQLADLHARLAKGDIVGPHYTDPAPPLAHVAAYAHAPLSLCFVHVRTGPCACLCVTLWLSVRTYAHVPHGVFVSVCYTVWLSVRVFASALMHMNVGVWRAAEVRGYPGKTAAGELSVWATGITLLAPCLHPLPLDGGLTEPVRALT